MEKEADLYSVAWLGRRSFSLTFAEALMSSTPTGRSQAARFRPTVQNLEDRSVPAGNVTAFVSGGILHVLGDDADNAIWVAGTGKRSAIIRPLDGTTTINGSSLGVWVGDITRGYNIRLNGGNDNAVITGLNARRILAIDLGSGDDTVGIADVRSRRETYISGGEGNDTLKVGLSNFRRRTVIDMGQGQDTVELGSSRFGATTSVDGGSGRNGIRVGNLLIDGPGRFVNFDPSAALDNPPTAPPTVPPPPTAPAPIAVSDEAKVEAGGSVVIPVLANDLAPGSDFNPRSLRIVRGASNGTVTANSDGTFTYTSTGAIGDDTFIYSFRNTEGTPSNEAAVSVTVTSPPVAPPTPPVPSAPTPTITSTAVNPTNLNAIPITVRFDENVSGFDLSDVTVTNGSTGNFTAVDGQNYTFNVQPAGDGAITITVPAGAAIDADGIGSVAATPFTITSIRTDAGMTDTIPDANSPNFVDQGNGLRIWDVQTGSGPVVAAGNTITNFYTGFLLNGTIFDSRRSPQNAIDFNLNNLIQGFQLGIPGMRVGGIRRLYIPSNLAYGSTGTTGIPPNSDLIFEVKVIAVS